MLNATPEELQDLADRLNELSARVRVASTMMPEKHPNELDIRQQLVWTGLQMIDVAGPTPIAVIAPHEPMEVDDDACVIA